MSLGNRIAEYRKACKLSQNDLADKIGVSRSAIAKWENDNGMPDIENIQLLAKEFQITVDQLLNAENISDLQEEINEQKQVKTFEQYQNQICDIELTDWNDGVWETLLIGEDDRFLFYRRQEKKQTIAGAIAKKFITDISVKEKSKQSFNEDLIEKVNITFFQEKTVDIYLEDKHIWSGILGTDTELRNTHVVEITNEYIKIEPYTNKIELETVVKIEYIEKKK